MKKRNAVLSLLLFLIALAGMGYVALVGIGPTKTGSMGNIKQGLDLAGGVSITYQVVGEEKPSAADMSDTIYKLQKRVEGYSTEAQVYQEGEDRINIEIPGVSDANAILQELGQPGSLYFIAATDDAGNYNYTMMGIGENGKPVYVLNKTIDELLADGSIKLDGTMVASADAAQRTDNSALQQSQYVVDLTFTPEGTQAFAEATERAYTKGETIAIYYDGELVSVPSVSSVITGGQAQISGMGSIEEARTLASTIRIGGLKLELEEMRSNVVGAQLGSDAINTSLKAAVIGFVLVCIFMIVVYLLPGFASALALTMYVVLTLLVLNGFNLTLTLPGIAGIILSIGMAVDANVIIFARVREELAEGKTVKSSLNAGFQKAMSAILDGNITTLIAAAVLGWLGSGSVKGFAQTLAMGIVVSMFTALVITRIIIYSFYAVGLRSQKLYGHPKKAEGEPVDFLGKRKVFFGISIALILIGFVFMGINGAQGNGIMNYSLEFMGGTSTNITFDKDYTLEEIDQEIVPLIEDATGDNNVQVQKVEGTNQVIFKTQTLDLAKREAFVTAMTDRFDVDEGKITTENISSTVSSEMRQDAVVAVIVATICMLLYIWFRFKDIRFATSAVLALLHDVLVVLAFYVVARVSVGNTFIACMLTIVGYSINATIVIFDRIREELRTKKKNEALDVLVNRCITKTLTRSIYTSLTTFVMVAVLYIMGVSSIKEFALPLMVGIVCGAYSSVCITGALWHLMKTHEGKNAEPVKNK